MSGETNTSIGRSLGISAQSVGNYRRKVVHPALRTAGQIALTQRNGPDNITLTSQDSELAKQVITSSPLRQRLDALGSRIDNILTRAENAVQCVPDSEGNLVPIADDLSILAPLYNQAHKNLEVLGKLTGELQDKAPAPSIAIQIVVPAASVQPRMSDEGYIDVGGAEIGSKR